MASLNRVQLIGNLGRDPELRYSPDGTAVCNFSIATTEQWTKDGAKQEKTEWHRISMWGKLGEVAGQYLKKGRQVYVEGSIRSREYVNKEGVKATAFEIRGDRMVLLNSGERTDGQAYQKPAQAAAPAAAAPAGLPYQGGVNTANSTVNGEQVPEDDDAPF